MKKYIPNTGDIVWMDLDPTLGKEQQGRRPVVVITDAKYNQFGLCITLPISSKIKGYNTEVKLPTKMQIEGAILTNHPRSHDWTIRNIKFIESLDGATFQSVKIRLKVLLGL
ncbi:MAG: type II toxin-antitoxin system PemK/MazF family toxin [Saprospiraceae bacterium]|jgi:mRNA interferase MazF|nr:type II toxin-antitoxin system PemK/MazF family toxin [Saprospiraceae bacterium]